MQVVSICRLSRFKACDEEEELKLAHILICDILVEYSEINSDLFLNMSCFNWLLQHFCLNNLSFVLRLGLLSFYTAISAKNRH